MKLILTTNQGTTDKYRSIHVDNLERGTMDMMKVIKSKWVLL